MTAIETAITGAIGEALVSAGLIAVAAAGIYGLYIGVKVVIKIAQRII